MKQSRIAAGLETSLTRQLFNRAKELDNVIDLNYYPVPYAEITNREYRSVGLGVSGYHHMLAKHGIACRGLV